jgi:hypothetical protein
MEGGLVRFESTARPAFELEMGGRNRRTTFGDVWSVGDQFLFVIWCLGESRSQCRDQDGGNDETEGEGCELEFVDHNICEGMVDSFLGFPKFMFM